MKKLSKQTFADLKNSGHCVPRTEATGQVISFKVGGTFTLTDGTEQLKVKCTQSHPTHLILID